MASVPITSWQIDGETVETVKDFILGAPKSLQMVTAAMKLKERRLLLGRKVMTNLEKCRLPLLNLRHKWALFSCPAPELTG